MRSSISCCCALLLATVLFGAEDDSAYKQGRGLLFDGQSRKAVEVLREFLKTHPQHIEAHRAYQDALWLVDRDKVLLEYTKYLEAAPSDPDRLYLLGRLLAKSRRVKESRERFDQCLKVAPKHHWARMGLATHDVIAKDEAHAILLLDELLKEKPDDFDALSMRCVLALSRKDAATFEDGLRKLKLLSLEDPADQLALSDLLCVAGQMEQGRAIIANVLQKHPRSPQALLKHASLLGAERDFPAAEEALKKAISIEPNLADLHRFLAMVYGSTGKPDLAQAEMELYGKLGELSAGYAPSPGGEVSPPTPKDPGTGEKRDAP